MSIFKESFREYVKKQFGVRQAVISRGNSDRAGLGPTSRMAELPADSKGGIPKIQAGAFYAYNQKQCVIRLSSMVDLMEDIGLDLGGSTFESYKGETFSRNFILEGGILSDYARNDEEGRQVTRKLEEVRGGFPSSKKKVNLSYGDPSIASDPRGGSDGYGAVPKPGIIDANIRTKSAYGSLRQAKVNFVCHNLRQLEILELLYMRPGYPVLMEWGWSPFIDNEGNIVNTFNSISDNDWFWNDSNPRMDQQFIQQEIIRRKESFNGNYDGFIGFVTNFDYSARPDGGFNCSTELISMGEVLDSLKVPGVDFSSLNINEDDPNKEAKLYQSSLGVIINDLITIGNESELKREADARVVASVSGFGASGGGAGVYSGNLDRALQNRTEVEENIEVIKEKITELLGDQVAQEGFIRKDQVIESNGVELQTKEAFVRWDVLSTLINEFVIPTNENGTKPLRIETNRFVSNPNGGGQFGLDPLLYCSYEDYNSEIMDVSCDASVCILPHQFVNFNQDENALSFSERIGRIGIFFGGRFSRWKGWDWITEAFTAENRPDRLAENFQNYQIDPETSRRRIGSIFIGIGFLDKIFQETFLNNRDATLGNFLKNLWDAINEQCPMHNFVLRVDQEFTDIVQVIDLPIPTKDLDILNYDDLFKFNVHSNDTIVREFKFDAQIPDGLKATIAINAQSGATADDLDSVTFAAFNRSIKSRLSSLNEKFSENEKISYTNIYNIRSEKDQRLFKLQDKIIAYNNLFFNLIDKKDGDDYDTLYGNIKSIIKEAQSLELYLEQSTSGYLKNQAIIPINLTLSIDGISGIIIGNVFKVDETRLPRAYRQRRVGFVVLGEDQNITSGQDWTTNIRGQIILFPSKQEVTDLEQFRTTPVDRTVFTDPVANEVAKINADFAVAESTAVDLSVQEEQVRIALGLDPRPDSLDNVGLDSNVNAARRTLAGDVIFGGGEGYSLVPNSSGSGLYELYQKQNPDGSYNLTYIQLTGDNKGLIVDVVNVPDIDSKTIFDIERDIIAFGRFE